MFAPPVESGRSTIGGNNTILSGIAESDARVERMRRANRHRMVQRELDEERQYLESVQSAEQRRRAMEREAAIAHRLEAEKTAALRSSKTIQRVHEETPELRGLRRAIQAAVVNKTRAEQLVEKERLEAAERERAAAESAANEAARLAGLEAERRQEQLVKERGKLNAEELQQQALERERARLEAYKEFLREKAMVDEIVERVKAEEAAAVASQLEHQRRTKAFIDEFREQRAAARQVEVEQEAEEDRKILEYMKLQNARAEDTRRRAQLKLDEQNRILIEQSANIAAERRAKEERERLLNEYYTEQREEALRLDEEKRKQRVAESKVELRRYADLQMRIAAARKAQQAAEEEELRKRLMAQFADEQRADRESAVLRAKRRQEYCQEIDQLIDQRRKLKQAEWQRQEKEERAAVEAAEERAELVRHERLRLLREHGIGLIAFLPKGTIQSSDLQELGLTPQQIREIEQQMLAATRR